MLSVDFVNVSEGWIKSGQAEASATKQTKERNAPFISNQLDSASFSCKNLKFEPSFFDAANLSSPTNRSTGYDDTSFFVGCFSPDHQSGFVFDSPGHFPHWIHPGSRSESGEVHVEDTFIHDSVPATSDFLRVKLEAGQSHLGSPLQSSDHHFGFVFDSPRHFPLWIHPGSRSDSGEVQDEVAFARLHLKPEASCFLFQASSEAASPSCPQSAASVRCDGEASKCLDGFQEFNNCDNVGPSLEVKIVAVTAKTNLSKKIDLEKLCEADSTHFGFRVAHLDPECSKDSLRPTQDFRNSIQYLLQFPAPMCDSSCKKFTGRIFHNGTVTISSIKTSNDITGTVDQCLRTVVEQIRRAHDASVASGSIVVQNLQAEYLTFADPQFSLNLTFPLGFLVNYPKLRKIFKQGEEFIGLDDTKITINSTKEEQKCGQGVFLKVSQSKIKFSDEVFHASFTVFHTGTVQARATCKNLEEMEYLISNMYHVLNIHRFEIMPLGPDEEFISKRRSRRQNPSAARSHPYDDAKKHSGS